MRSTLGILARGMAMGAADVVPGVSGGTIALITGIYDRLLAAIASADLTLLTLVLRGRFAEAWRHMDGGFLMTLLAGIAIAVISLANVINWVLSHYPVVLWSFFFGLVGASAVALWRSEVGAPMTSTIVPAALGLISAVAIALAPAAQFIPGLPGFFLAGSIAICAMILPGISGSFILLLLGMYQPVIAALVTPEPSALLIFATGCGVGLMLFSKVLHWLLDHHRRPLMALLTGFLAGSMTSLWPWQKALSTVVDRHGELRPVQQVPVGPSAYAGDGGEPMVMICVIACVAGVALILATERWVRPDVD
jgi:putative membrane protein